MKSLKKNVVLLLGAVLGAMLVNVPAHAQGDRVAANVPFDFAVGKFEFKAGSYRIQRLSGTPFVSLTDADGKTRYTMLTPGGKVANRNGQPYLVFTRYGSESFLSKIVFSVDNNYQLPQSNREKEVMSKLVPGEQTVVPIQPGQD